MDASGSESYGYKQAIKDIMAWHTSQVEQLTAKAKEAYVGSIHIGSMWEGKHVSAVQLMDLAIFHTQCLQYIEEKFNK